MSSKRLYVATGNAGKLATVKGVLPSLDVVGVDLDLVEIQDVDVRVVAEHKAREAWERLGEPVMVEDGGLFVECLGGWPGAFTKPFLEKVGIDGLLRLVERLPADASFVSAVAYCDEGGVRIWSGETRRGALVSPGDEVLPEEAWSGLWRVFRPIGSERTLSLMSAEERERGRPSTYPLLKFSGWMEDRA